MSLSGCRIVLKDGQLTRTSLVDLQASTDSVRKAGGNPTIVIHFHGGLVTEKEAHEGADRLAPEYASAGAVPVFVIWQSGLLETIRNNWKEAFGKTFFEGVLERVLQFLVGRAQQPPGARATQLDLPERKDVQRELARREEGEEPYGGVHAEPSKMKPELTPAEEKQLAQTIEYDQSLSASAHGLLQNLDTDLFNPELRDEILKARKQLADGERGIVTGLALGVAVKAFMGSLRRFSRGRGHGLYPTAVEEVAKAIFAAEVFGRFAWDSMKNDTRDAFGDGDDQFGGAALLHQLGRIWEAGLRPRIVLVGHSAGGIFICEFLKAASKRNMPADAKFDVILFAPACTFRLFDDTLTLAPNRISSFRCFAMSDDLEQKDHLLGPFYPRSLLYLVSGTLEDTADEPLLGMQRFHSRQAPFNDEDFPNIKRVLDEMASQQKAWVWSISSAGAGLNCAAKSHGGFDFENATLESVKHILQYGVGA